MLDALQLHLRAIDSIDWDDPAPGLSARMVALSSREREASAGCDGHVAYVNTHDARRDEVRARRFLEALGLARSLATSGERLTWSTLRKLQATALGRGAVGFRCGVAHAKRGLERYGWADGLERQFTDRLDLATSIAPHPVARAAMLYLDVCFFHPFDDGNGRAARLVLDYTLSQASVTLGQARLVFALPIPAGRRGAYVDFLSRLVKACELGTRARRVGAGVRTLQTE